MTFEEMFPAGAAKLSAALQTMPPRQAQHDLVLQWPFFSLGCDIAGIGFPFLSEDGEYLPQFSFRPKGLLLVGPSGFGKTTSAWAVIKKTLREWESNCSATDIFCWRAVELGHAIGAAASGKGDNDESGRTAMQILSWRLIKCGLLFLDDLDKTRFTPRVQSEVFNVIEAREAANLPLIVTTNCSGKELAALFDKNIGCPIVNRLSRMCYMVDFGDANFDYDGELAAIQDDLILRARGQSAVIEAALKPRIEAKRLRDEAERAALEARQADGALLKAAFERGTGDGLPDHLQARFRADATRNRFAMMRAMLENGAR